ncbi:guanylate cyclase 32E-like [Octopus vulgaris]|uniref:guanylate cyclase n=1 Tax=Octopus vulgaris TaxID=6645 RepID=A0AA36C0N2_OCTVU|nr:guanylate cyclase 32E-like [Octopus vulgaris]
MTPSTPSHSATTAASVSAAASAVVHSDSSPRTMAMITRTPQPDKGIIMTRLTPTAELPPPQQTPTNSLQGSGLSNSEMDDMTLSKPTKCLTNVSRQESKPGEVFTADDSFSSSRETEGDLDKMDSSAIQSDSSGALSKENTSSYKRRTAKNRSKMNASVFKADESDITPQTHRSSYKRRTDRNPNKNDTGVLRDHTDNISHTNSSISDGQINIHLDKNSTDASQSGHTNITPQANDSDYTRRTDRHFNKNDTDAFQRDYSDNIPSANGSISKRKTDRHLNGNDTDVFQRSHTGAIPHANGSANERQTDRYFTKNDTRVFQRNQTDITPQTNVSNYETDTDRHFHKNDADIFQSENTSVIPLTNSYDYGRQADRHFNKNDTDIFQTDETDIAPHTNGSGYETQTDRQMNKSNTDNFKRENANVILHSNSSDDEGQTDRHFNKNYSDIFQRDKTNVVPQPKNFGYKWKANQSLDIKDVKVFLADDSNVTPRANSSGYKRGHDKRSGKINAVISDTNTSKSLSVANFTSYRRWITNKILGKENSAFFPKAISNNRNATYDSSDGGRFSKEDPFGSLPSTTVRGGVHPTSPLVKLPSATERKRLCQNNSCKDLPSAIQREGVYQTSPLKDLPLTTDRSVHQLNLLKELSSTTERGGSHPTKSYEGLSSAVKSGDMHQSNSLEGLPTTAEGRREHQTNVLHGLPITERGIQPLMKNERSYSHGKLSKDDTFRDSTYAYDAQQFLSFRHINRTSIGDPPDDIGERKREGGGMEGEQEEGEEDEEEESGEGEFGQKNFTYDDSYPSMIELESDIIQSDTGAWTTRDKLEAPNVIRLGYLTGSQTRTMRRENSKIYRRSSSSGSSTSSSKSKRSGDEYYRRPGQAISGALSLAVAEINSDPSILPEHRLEFIPQETYGEESESIRKTTLLLDANISAYIGPQETCLYEARIAAVFNVPMLSYLLEANNIAVTQQEMYDGPYFHNHVENPFADIVSRTYVDTRIYVMLGQSYDFVGLMSNLYERGLLDSGEYFVVGVYLDYYDYSNPAKYLAGASGLFFRINSDGDVEGNFSLVARRYTESKGWGLYPVGVFLLSENLTGHPPWLKSLSAGANLLSKRENSAYIPRVNGAFYSSQLSLGSHLEFNEARHLYTRVGTYRGQLVAIRHVNKKQVELTRAVRKELKIIRELRHPNINPFIGACVDGPYVLIISEYCSKGSLQGMSYLHDSEVKSHGKLKSSNCVVDSRWVLKVTDFGLHQFMADAKDDIGEFAYHRKIIERVRRPHNGVPFRPRLAALETIERCTTDVIKECWDEEPNKRPDFKVIRHKLKPMLKGMKSNIFDNMVAMMEKYASNLEAVIQDRTGQLIEEKKKTEELLLQMLPR